MLLRNNIQKFLRPLSRYGLENRGECVVFKSFFDFFLKIWVMDYFCIDFLLGKWDSGWLIGI